MVNKVEGAYTPDYAVTPGEMLEYEMEIRGMTQQELVRRTGVTGKHINASIINGSSITLPMDFAAFFSEFIFNITSSTDLSEIKPAIGNGKISSLRWFLTTTLPP